VTALVSCRNNDAPEDSRRSAQSVEKRQNSGSNRCPYCGDAGALYLSQPKTWHDEVCSFFFLQAVRCHSCMRRHYRPLFLSPVPVKPQKKTVRTHTDENEKRERSA
jgi:hypothetical protein